MNKSCVICGNPAVFMIKESQDAYCEICATDCFSDTSFLVKVEDQAKKLKELVKKRIEEEN